MNPLKVLWVEDSVVFRGAPIAIFAGREDVRVAVCSSRSFIRGTAKMAHDVVVFDAVTWGAGLQALVEAVRRSATVVPVVLLGTKDLLHEHVQVIREGVTAYVTHQASEREVWEAVRAAGRGQQWIEKGLAFAVLAEVHGTLQDVARTTFSRRERQVLDAVANGKTNKEIASALGCNERRVKGYMTSLMRKIGAVTRSGLASYAVTKGLARLQ